MIIILVVPVSLVVLIVTWRYDDVEINTFLAEMLSRHEFFLIFSYDAKHAINS